MLGLGSPEFQELWNSRVEKQNLFPSAPAHIPCLCCSPHPRISQNLCGALLMDVMEAGVGSPRLSGICLSPKFLELHPPRITSPWNCILLPSGHPRNNSLCALVPISQPHCIPIPWCGEPWTGASQRVLWDKTAQRC